MHKMDRIALQSIPTQLTTTKHVCVVSAVKMFVVSAIVTDIILRIRKIKSFFFVDCCQSISKIIIGIDCLCQSTLKINF
jgi:hypothetical protein